MRDYIRKFTEKKKGKQHDCAAGKYREPSMTVYSPLQLCRAILLSFLFRKIKKFSKLRNRNCIDDLIIGAGKEFSQQIFCFESIYKRLRNGVFIYAARMRIYFGVYPKQKVHSPSVLKNGIAELFL